MYFYFAFVLLLDIMQLFTSVFDVFHDVFYFAIQRIFESRCCKMLNEIRAVLRNEKAEEDGSFFRIKKIIRIFEEKGIDVGNRLDF